MIRWTSSEIKLLAKTFLDVRCQDMISPVSTILEEAQKACLPEDRRRQYPLAALGWEVQNEIKVTLQIFAKQMATKTETAPAPLPPVTSEAIIVPDTETKKPEAPTIPAFIPPPQPFVIEFRIPKVEKPDIHKILEGVPTSVLYGYALDRLMKTSFNGGFHPQPYLPEAPPAKPKTDVVQVDALQAQEPIAPTILKADSVEDPIPSADGRRRVLVLGLLPSAQKIAQEKAMNLLRLDTSWADANTRVVPTAAVDCAILMRGVVTKFQEEQIRKRFSTQDRIFHCETTDELMAKLRDLNSLM